MVRFWYDVSMTHSHTCSTRAFNVSAAEHGVCECVSLMSLCSQWHSAQLWTPRDIRESAVHATERGVRTCYTRNAPIVRLASTRHNFVRTSHDLFLLFLILLWHFLRSFRQYLHTNVIQFLYIIIFSATHHLRHMIRQNVSVHHIVWFSCAWRCVYTLYTVCARRDYSYSARPFAIQLDSFFLRAHTKRRIRAHGWRFSFFRR